MDEDRFALVEKILIDVDNVISKNADLCAFDIVPVESNFQNKTPVLHLENCLGLESWCVKHVYMYCYNELMDKYFCKPKRKAVKLSSFNSERMTRLLNLTLLLNPDLMTLWNKRREIFLKFLLDRPSEIQFTRLVLSRKPKCNDAFAYRRWLLEPLLQDESLQSNYIENMIAVELSICDLTSQKSPNNYHSWNHRIWVIQRLKSLEKQFDLDYLYIKEYEFSEKWSSKHVSDFCCFHYRQMSIKNIFKISNGSWKTFDDIIDINMRKSFLHVIAMNFPHDATVQGSEEDLLCYSEENIVNLLFSYTSKKCNCIINNVLMCRKMEILFHELVLNNELIQFYKNHETLWYHRRFIVHELLLLMYDHFGLIRQNGSLVKSTCRKCNVADMRQKQAKIVRYDSNFIYSSVFFNVLLCHEKKFIGERQNNYDNYADRHKKYLKFVEGLNAV